MGIRKQMILAGCVALTSMVACSRKATVPPQYSYAPMLYSSSDDKLLLNSEIDFSFYTPELAKPYVPALEIRDSFNYVEKCMVGVSDDQFFARRQELVINFAQLDDKAFAFPLPGARVVSAYGRRNGRPHTGIDIKINRHDTILSAFDGVVRMVGTSRGYGKVVVVRHYNGLETVYAHASKQLVRSGDHIAAGTPIALTGATGRASGDHLHFEVRINGKPFDPRRIIDFENQSLLPQNLVFSPGKKGNINIEGV